jgi:hypothetical protein
LFQSVDDIVEAVLSGEAEVVDGVDDDFKIGHDSGEEWDKGGGLNELINSFLFVKIT